MDLLFLFFICAVDFLMWALSSITCSDYAQIRTLGTHPITAHEWLFCFIKFLRSVCMAMRRLACETFFVAMHHWRKSPLLYRRQSSARKSSTLVRKSSFCTHQAFTRPNLVGFSRGLGKAGFPSPNLLLPCFFEILLSTYIFKQWAGPACCA